jgi:hypothetical protein
MSSWDVTCRQLGFWLLMVLVALVVLLIAVIDQ